MRLNLFILLHHALLYSGCCLLLLVTQVSYATSHTIKQEKPISLQFRNTPIQTILQAIADDQQLNLLIADDIQGSYNIRLEQVSWQDAMTALTELAQLQITLHNNIMLVTANDRLQRQHPLTESIEQQLSSLHYQPEHQNAEQLAQILSTHYPSLLSSRSQLIIDKRNNGLIILDSNDNLFQIKQLLPMLDNPVQQVQLTAHIVNMNSENVRQLGVTWSMGESMLNHSWRLNEFNINLPVANATSSIGFQLARLDGRLLDLELSALEAENHVEIIASPRLLTLNGQTASIRQGTEIPYESAKTDNTPATIAFKDAVLSLEVTPQILPNNNIELLLTITQNTPGKALVRGDGSEILAINTQEIRTNVVVKHQQTLVLGGVFQQSHSQSAEQVPWLSRLPLLGYLFRRTSHRQEKRQLMIFITPEIVGASISG